ncbi:MAG: YraN family protein [Bifidobacteriaceae bacterium]|nr:YraN family protein [Bifidobacteriaceae bacterium]
MTSSTPLNALATARIAPSQPNDRGEPAGTLQRLARTLNASGLASHDLGRLGEEFACRVLADRGWRIVDRNWRSRYGELDIVALDTDDVLVFVEVKTRRGHAHGTPQEAVTLHKQIAMRRASTLWMRERRPGMRRLRYDVIAIEVRPQDRDTQRLPAFTHVEGAL